MLREALKATVSTGLRRTLRDLATEIRVHWHHRRSVRRAARFGGRELRLNIGCGRDIRVGWVNIDLNPQADLRLDLRECLPFPDASAAVIYSEHFFEHLEYEDARRFLAESRRVLQPGGLFSVGVPDTEWPLKAYASSDEEYFVFVRNGHHPAWCRTRLQNINYHFRQGREHKYAYDLETLTQMLHEAGFASIARRAFDRALDNPRRERGTLYVDARTPGDMGGDGSRERLEATPHGLRSVLDQT